MPDEEMPIKDDLGDVSQLVQVAGKLAVIVEYLCAPTEVSVEWPIPEENWEGVEKLLTQARLVVGRVKARLPDAARADLQPRELRSAQRILENSGDEQRSSPDPRED